MKYLRLLIPFLAIIALGALFFKLPETPNPFGILGCKSCVADNSIMTLFSAAYFSFLLALSLLFPSFPSREVARGGLLWALLLAMTLTYVSYPLWCVACLICHVCHILIWMIWLLAPSQISSSLSTRERSYLALLMPIVVVALFSSLNLTYMVYDYKHESELKATELQVGDSLPAFNVKTASGHTLTNETLAGTAINFITPNCNFCKEQLSMVNSLALERQTNFSRLINVSPMLAEELLQLSPDSDWIEDSEGKLREQFKVLGYPTLFVFDDQGKIKKIIAGASQELQSEIN